MRIILRTEGSARVGFGHVYRSLAIADILKNDFECSFAIAGELPAHIRQAMLPAFKLIGLPDTDDQDLHLADHLRGDEIVVTDGYSFGPEYHRRLQEKGCITVRIDDFGKETYNCNALINHAPGLGNDSFAPSRTKLFLGLDYAMLRSPFFRNFSQKKNPKGLLLNFGGSDFYNYTPRFLETLARDESWSRVEVVITKAYDELALSQVRDIATKHAHVHVHENLSGQSMAALIDGCTHALVSASTVLIECYARGLTCFTGYYVANQELIYNGFVREKRAFGLGDLRLVTAEDAAREMQRLLNGGEQPETLLQPLSSEQNIRSAFQLLC